MANRIARLGIISSIVLFSNTSFASTVNDLLITEVMANPAALSDSLGEWFELYNPTDQQINLLGITLGDDGASRHSFDSDLLIMPGEYLTLARSSSPGFTADYVYNSFTLANTSDEIVFREGLTELLRLDYGPGFAVSGRSRELLQLPMQASNYSLTLASLTYGLGDVGTPGTAGGALTPPSAVPLPAAAWLFITGILATLIPTSLRTPSVVPAHAGTSKLVAAATTTPNPTRNPRK